MCNIAGYAGNKQAAPLLLEMLKRQEYYDGNVSTGIATIHEGKLYYRKFVGTVDELIAKSDVLNLPGTIGIAHTRPSGKKGTMAAQPNISVDETLALITNGTTGKHKYTAQWNDAVAMLLDKGYSFREVNCNSFTPPQMPKSGWNIFSLEVRRLLIEMHLAEGKSFSEALALSCARMYADNVTVTLAERHPDSIFALRTTRPLLALEEDGETYIATCRFAFDADKAEQAKYLPLHQVCEITRAGVRITQDKMDAEPVAEISEETFREGYRRLCQLLTVPKEKALYFDDLEFAVLDMRDIFEGDRTFLQHARLVYDVLWQLDKAGRLRKELRVQHRPNNTRQRWYMWLEN